MIPDDFQKETWEKTLRHISYLQTFLQSEGEARPPHEIPPDQLSNLLCKFFIDFRKANGKDYQPNTIKFYIYCFDRYLRHHDYETSLIHGRAFNKLQDVIQTKMEELKKPGICNIPIKTALFTEQEIEIFWEQGQLGTHTPDSVINTLWFNNSLHFGLMGSDVHRNLRWGDFRLCTYFTNQEYLEFQQQEAKPVREINLWDKARIWSTPDFPDRDPVAVYKLYATKRPQDYCNPNDPFYIATNQDSSKLKYQWFKRQPTSVDDLLDLMKRMRRACGLSEEKNLTNLSVQNHLVQKLSEANIPVPTSENNVQSVKIDSHINQNQPKQISQELLIPSPNQGPKYYFDRHKKNKFTKAKTKTSYALGILQTFLQSKGESRQAYEIPPDQLSNLLCTFFYCVRKPNGTDYLPHNIRSFMYSFDRHLCTHGYKSSLKHGQEFSKLREVIRVRQNELRTGEVHIPRKSKTTTIQDMEILWELGLLGKHTADSVINTLWFNNSVHFGLKGTHAHRDLRWGDVRLCTDSTKQEYLEFQEQQAKTGPGTNLRDEQNVKHRMYSTPEFPDRDPVAVYKLYATKRPQEYSNPNDPFYIATNKGNPMVCHQWFNRQPFGLNKLMSLVLPMKRACGLTEEQFLKFLTDFSAQKHMEQKLSENNIQPMSDDNVQSVNIDNHIGQDQPMKLSQVLSIPSLNLTPTQSLLIQQAAATYNIHPISSGSAQTPKANLGPLKRRMPSDSDSA